MEDQQIKYQKLIDILSDVGSAVIAFSGGVDSSFLLTAAQEALGDKVLAVTVDSAFSPANETEEAAAFCRSRGIMHTVLTVDPLSERSIAENPPDRCYHCKKLLFSEILRVAEMRGIPYVCEGTHADDISDYRPGMRAVAELGIHSPLCEAGLTKAEIRALSGSLGLPSWNRPAMACLASRIPYGELLTAEKLRMTDRAEALLRSLGMTQVRVRMHGRIARIEVLPEEISILLAERTNISAQLKALGYSYVTLDLQGYRTGSLNEAL